MSVLKEATFTLNGKYNYHIMHKEEQVLLKEHVELEEFLEEVNSLYTNVDWLKAVKWVKVQRWFQLVVALVLFGFLAFFLAAVFMMTAAMAELLYTAFCGVLILMFLSFMFMVFVEAKIMGPYIKKVKEIITKRVEDRFTNTTFFIGVDRQLSIRVRPISFENEKLGLDKMDYYDYINNYNPEDEEYYKKNNPLELDPHQKNIKGEIVKNQEMEDAKTNKMKFKSKFLKVAK